MTWASASLSPGPRRPAAAPLIPDPRAAERDMPETAEPYDLPFPDQWPHRPKYVIVVEREFGLRHVVARLRIVGIERERCLIFGIHLGAEPGAGHEASGGVMWYHDGPSGSPGAAHDSIAVAHRRDSGARPTSSVSRTRARDPSSRGRFPRPRRRRSAAAIRLAATRSLGKRRGNQHSNNPRETEKNRPCLGLAPWANRRSGQIRADYSGGGPNCNVAGPLI